MNKVFNYIFSILVFLLPISNLFLQLLASRFSWGEYLFLYKDLLLLPLIGYLVWQIGFENWQKIKFLQNINLQVETGKSGNGSIDSKNTLVKQASKYIQSLYKLALFNWEISLLGALHLIIFASSFVNDISVATFFKAYYFEIWWLDFFVLIRVWLKYHKKNKLLELSKYLKASLLLAYICVIVLSFTITIFGQNQILSNFGYSTDLSVVEKNTTSLISSSPVCHYVDAGIHKCRLMASFAHPLHLASYLLVMICLLVIWSLETKNRWLKFGYFLLITSGIYFIYETFARYSWLTIFLFASLVMIYAFYLAFKKYNFSLLISKLALIFCLLLAIFTGQIVFNTDLKNSPNLPNWLVKTGSNDWHYRRTQASIDIIQAKPEKISLGYGLGAIGSSARAKYQDLNKNFIYSNYKELGFKYYLQPEEMLLLDNWFLQVLINGGIYYFTVYMVLLLLPTFYLVRFLRQKKWDKQSLGGLFFVCTFVGILIGNSLQLLFESQTLAIYWSVLYLFFIKSQSLPSS